ncbi:hypothetical protein Tco_0291294 [Tanacetum coccineum]
MLGERLFVCRAHSRAATFYMVDRRCGRFQWKIDGVRVCDGHSLVEKDIEIPLCAVIVVELSVLGRFLCEPQLMTVVKNEHGSKCSSIKEGVLPSNMDVRQIDGEDVDEIFVAEEHEIESSLVVCKSLTSLTSSQQFCSLRQEECLRTWCSLENCSKRHLVNVHIYYVTNCEPQDPLLHDVDSLKHRFQLVVLENDVNCFDVTICLNGFQLVPQQTKVVLSTLIALPTDEVYAHSCHLSEG